MGMKKQEIIEMIVNALPDAKVIANSFGAFGGWFCLSILIILKDPEPDAFIVIKYLVFDILCKLYAVNPLELKINLPSTTAYASEQAEFPVPDLTKAQ